MYFQSLDQSRLDRSEFLDNILFSKIEQYTFIVWDFPAPAVKDLSWLKLLEWIPKWHDKIELYFLDANKILIFQKCACGLK